MEDDVELVSDAAGDPPVKSISRQEDRGSSINHTRTFGYEGTDVTSRAARV